MALRIIRKSASQSQVEVIRGKSDEKPQYSVLCFFDSIAQIEACKSLIENSEKLSQQAEFILMKSSKVNAGLRKQFEAQEHTIKLVNEPKDASWSLRLRTLMQEASTELCVFLPSIVSALNEELIHKLQSHLAANPLVGMVAPSLSREDKILGAGQDYFQKFHSHQLSCAEWSHTFESKAQELFYFYQDFPLKLWQETQAEVLQSAALPLVCCALRRSAYLALSWKDNKDKLPWLAQELGYLMRREQFQLDVLRHSLELSGEEAALLDAGPQPNEFLEKWAPQVRVLLKQIYYAHGWDNTLPDQWSRTMQHAEAA